MVRAVIRHTKFLLLNLLQKEVDVGRKEVDVGRKEVDVGRKEVEIN
jgi:hypothetical protein